MLSDRHFSEALENKRRDILRETKHNMSVEEEKQFAQSFIPDKEVTLRMQKSFALENMLKNVTIRQIVKIREIKEKRSLKEAVKQILAQRREEEAKKRRKLKKKITREYEDIAGGDDPEEEKDGQYRRIIVNMDRLLKILTAHSTAVDSLEKQLNAIESSKKKSKGRSQKGSEDTYDPKKRGQEDKMFNTGEIEGFDGHDVDDLDFYDKEEKERDNFMEELKGGYEPSEKLLAPYRIPIENQRQLNVNSDRESLHEVTSEESEQDQQMSDGSPKSEK